MALARLSGNLYLVDDQGQVIDEYGPNYGIWTCRSSTA